MTITPPAPPPLPDELDRLLRRLWLPYVRRAAPEVLATANSQRWDTPKSCECCSPRRPPAATQQPSRSAAGRPGCQQARPSRPGRPPNTRSRKPPSTRSKPGNGSSAPKRSSLAGPSGTGKSHFIEALGHLAIDNGKTVAWHTLETLAALLRRHRADDSINKAISRLIRADLILIDDVGLLPVSPDAAEALFRVVDGAYEKRSIALSSNIHPSGFDELMPKTLATATVERLLHHAHVIITDGHDSYRLAQATTGKRVKPLT